MLYYVCDFDFECFTDPREAFVWAATRSINFDVHIVMWFPDGNFAYQTISKIKWGDMV